MEACPKCKSTYGYYQQSRVSGYATFIYNWDGTTGDSTDAFNSVTYKDLKTLRCCQCHAVIKLPKQKSFLNKPLQKSILGKKDIK